MNANQVTQVANFLKVSPNQIKRCEEWASILFVQVHGCRPRFVSKKVVKMSNFVKVNCFKEQVVIDMDSQVGYVVRPGYDLGNFYLIKRFDPKGKDVRGLDYSTVNGEQLPDQPTNPERSEEYQNVVAALGFHNKSLVGYGMPGQCRFPNGYTVEV